MLKQFLLYAGRGGFTVKLMLLTLGPPLAHAHPGL